MVRFERDQGTRQVLGLTSQKLVPNGSAFPGLPEEKGTPSTLPGPSACAMEAKVGINRGRGSEGAMRIGVQRLVPSRELRKPLSLPVIHRRIDHRYPVLRGGWEGEEKGEGRGGGEGGDTCRCGEKEQGSDWKKQRERT